MALNHACNCCEEPPCAEPVLQFISIEASCEVCGYALPDHEDLEPGDECLRFATKTVSSTSVTELTEYPGYNSYFYNDTENKATTWGKTPEGCEDVALTTHFDDTETTQATDGSDTPVVDSVAYTVYDSASGVCIGSYTFTDNLDAGNNESDSYTDGCSSIDYTPDDTWTKTGLTFTRYTPGDFPYPSETLTVVFSEPVTTCEPTLPDWPAWEGESEDALTTGQGYATSALRQASGTCGLTLTLRSVKWRVKHQPSGTCYLKAWIRKTVTPAVGSPTTTDSTYEWTGTGNPCLADPALAVDHADNLIHGSATEETAPEEPGEVTFEILKFSCVSGYEPDISDPENPQPNGFPDPTWEAAPP